jgi:DNA-nicking Smr family endonuclease
MEILDLHGKRHNEAELEVEQFLCSCGLPCKIITGNSKSMRNIVLREVKRLKLGVWDTGNYGCLTILQKKL